MTPDSNIALTCMPPPSSAPSDSSPILTHPPSPPDSTQLIIAGKTNHQEHKYEIRKFTSATSYMLGANI